MSGIVFEDGGWGVTFHEDTECRNDMDEIGGGEDNENDTPVAMDVNNNH